MKEGDGETERSDNEVHNWHPITFKATERVCSEKINQAFADRKQKSGRKWEGGSMGKMSNVNNVSVTGLSSEV